MQHEERAYLDLLVSLTDELGLATAALLSGDLSAFEQSVSRQQATCARLEKLQGRYTGKNGRQPVSPAVSGELSASQQTLQQQIDAAIDDLLAASERFEALLAHSSETTRLLSNLLRSYTGYLPQSNIPAAHPSTWSCQF